ncbi:hypothetical protein RFI_23824, partial [Reticulomyxa filosa]
IHQMNLIIAFIQLFLFHFKKTDHNELGQKKNIKSSGTMMVGNGRNAVLILIMLNQEEQLRYDEEIAHRLQQEELHDVLADHQYDSRDNFDISAPLLSGNNNNSNNTGNPNRAQGQIRRNIFDSVREADTESPRILLGRIIFALIEVREKKISIVIIRIWVQKNPNVFIFK